MAVLHSAALIALMAALALAPFGETNTHLDAHLCKSFDETRFSFHSFTQNKKRILRRWRVHDHCRTGPGEENTEDWHLVTLDSFEKQKLFYEIVEKKKGRKEWWFWFRLRRDYPKDRNEAVNASLWRDPNKWRWGRHGSYLNESFGMNPSAAPWAKNFTGRNETEPDNGEFVRNQLAPLDNNTMEMCAVARMIWPNASYPWFEWFDSLCRLESGSFLGNKLLESSLAVCELHCKATSSPGPNQVKDVASVSPKSDETSGGPWKWLAVALGVVVFVILLSVALVFGLWYSNRRRSTPTEKTFSKRRRHTSTRSDSDASSRSYYAVVSSRSVIHKAEHSLFQDSINESDRYYENVCPKKVVEKTKKAEKAGALKKEATTAKTKTEVVKGKKT